MVGQSPLVQATTGSGFELTVITAVVLGGANILGGSGSILGTFLGAVLVELIADGVVLYHIQPFWRGVVMGVMLVFAASLSVLSARKGRR